MKIPSIRSCYIIGALICLFLLISAVYLQLDESLAPCPLCQLQRFVFIILGFIFLFAALQNPRYNAVKRYGYVIFIFSIIGAAIAIRQLWLQNTPHPADETCGVGLNYLLKALPLSEAIKMIVEGSGDCAQVHWRFLGLTLPGWSLLGYVVLGYLGIWQNFRVKN